MSRGIGRRPGSRFPEVCEATSPRIPARLSTRLPLAYAVLEPYMEPVDAWIDMARVREAERRTVWHRGGHPLDDPPLPPLHPLYPLYPVLPGNNARRFCSWLFFIFRDGG